MGEHKKGRAKFARPSEGGNALEDHRMCIVMSKILTKMSKLVRASRYAMPS